MPTISGSIGSLLRTSGFPISSSFASGSEFTVSLLNGPGYITLESKRSNDGFYTSSANFAAVSSSNVVDRSTVSSDFIASAYLGYASTGSLTVTAARDLSEEEVLVRIVTINDISYVELPTVSLAGELLDVLQARATNFENREATLAILQSLENCEF